MNKATPWDNIEVPSADYTVVRVAETTGVPIYWGRDRSSQCLLIVELAGDFSDRFRNGKIALNGISVDLRMGEKPSQQRFVLILERHVDTDLFLGLCQTLIESLRHVEDPAVALALSLAHLKRWKLFLAGRGTRLSQEEVRGLFAELVFLRELIAHPHISDAIEAWKGPEKSHQDFIFENTAVEVKSLSGTERSTVRISSEDQLETLNDSLFLRIYRLSVIPESSVARSLNAIVAEVQDIVESAEAVESFQTKLAAHSYAPLPDYDEPLFVVSDIQTYRVEDGFPRLIRSEIPEGIGRVGYDIKLERIQKYICDPETIFGGDDGADG